MRKKAKKVDIIIIAVILLMIIGGTVLAVLPQKNQHQQTGNTTVAADTDGDGTVTYKDYIGKRIGIKTGSSFEAITFEYFPDSEYVYMESTSDLAVALEQNKIDAFVDDEPVVRMLNAENSNLDYIKQPIVDDDYSFMFQKGNERADKLRQQFNEMVSELNESGKLSGMTGKWFSNDDSVKTFDRTPSSGENGEIVAAGLPDNVPFSYYLNNEYTGFAVELITIFGQKYGYSVKFEQPNPAAVVAGVTSGLYDIGIGSISVTEERKESANFSDTVYKGGVMLAVRASDIAVQGETAAAGVNGGGSTYKDFNGKTLGILSGSAFEPTTFEKFPDSKYLYFNTYSDLNIALLEKRIDGYVADEPTARVTHKENSDISYLSEPLAVDSYYFMYSKTEAKSQTLLKQFNEMLSEMTSDGTLAELQDIWFGGDASLQTIDRSGITGENGIITVGTYSGVPPFTMFVSGELSGMTTDLMYRFARKYGYEPKFEDTDVNGCLAGLASGKYDMLAVPLSKTPERTEAADFSDPFYSADICLAVRTENAGTPALSYKDYAGKRVGILTGSSFEQPTFEFLPDSEYFYFDSFSDLIMALAMNKIDCFIEDEPLLRAAAIDHPELSYLPEILKEDKYSFCFQKNGEKAELLQKQFNEMIAELEADGTMESLRKKWYDGDASAAMIDRSGITGENGTLNVFVNPLNVPAAMIVDGELKGYAVELMTMFCRKYGYDCKYEQANISSGLAGIASGIYDVGANNVTVTPEREESVRFSDPIYYGGISLAVRKSDIYKSASAAAAENTGAKNIPGFFDSIALSFEKNFIRENRWKLIAEGIGTTCLITVMSAIFGSVLAFLVCMFRRTGSRLANGISNVYVKLLQGTPIVVLLMILYYVVLGKSGLEALWVAVIGFTLNFGAYASEIMRSGIESIDVGQREAALALGYTENQAFFKFIFPQAAVRFLPVYRGEIVSLLKSTSIVGYIAIQDLTKMSDIIRSRTYEAFFPLIATAIIYFVLAWIISLMLKFVLKAVDKRSRKRGTSK